MEAVSFETRSDRILKERKHEELCGKWKLIMTKNQIEVCVKYLAFLLNKKFDKHPKEIVLAGILKGVYMVYTDLSKQLTFDHSVYFIDASSYHGQEQGKVKIVNEIVPEKFKGKAVILVDELFDKGVTMHTVAKFLKEEQKVEEVYTCALWSKATKNQLPLPDFLAYQDIASVWLVGYGLDDNGKKRNWTELFAVPKPPEMERTEDDLIFESKECYETVCREISLRVDEMMRKLLIGK